MKGRLVSIAALGCVCLLPSSLARAAAPSAGVLYWSPKPGEVRVWVYSFGTKTIAGTFRFRGESSGTEWFTITNIVSASQRTPSQESGTTVACGLVQTTDSSLPGRSIATVSCPLKLRAGVKLDLDLAVTGNPKTGNAAYDFAGKPEFGYEGSAAAGAPPDFTVRSTWVDKKAKKLRVAIKNIGDAPIDRLSINPIGFNVKKLLLWRKLQGRSHVTSCAIHRQKIYKKTMTSVGCRNVIVQRGQTLAAWLWLAVQDTATEHDEVNVVAGSGTQTFSETGSIPR